MLTIKSGATYIAKNFRIQEIHKNMQSPFIAFISDVRYGIAQNLTVIIFLCILLLPLYKLSRSRVALILLLSKTTGNIIFMSLSMILMLIRTYNLAGQFDTNTIQAATTVQPLALRIHLLALAANRVHCVFFPIHYANSAGKKYIWTICFAIWLFSITYTTFCSVFLINQKVLYLLIGPSTVNAFCLYSSSFLYCCLAFRLLFLKFNSRNIGLSMSSQQQTEKSHTKICIVCFIGILPFAINQLAYWSISTFHTPDGLLADILFTIGLYSGVFSFFIEDLCLLIICSEFRRCFYRSNTIASQPNSNNKNNVHPINIAASSFIGSSGPSMRSMPPIVSRINGIDAKGGQLR